MSDPKFDKKDKIVNTPWNIAKYVKKIKIC